MHKGTAYPGEHEAIISQALWDKVHAILQREPATARGPHPGADAGAAEGADLRADRRAMSPTHTRKGGKLYRYYVSTDVLKRDADACPVRRVPAAEIESAVIDQVRGLLRVAGDHRRARGARRGKRWTDISEAEVREALQQLDPLWDELFPAEQARIVQLLVERVDVSPDGADIRLRTEGLTNLVADLRAVKPEARRAA